MNEWIWCYLSIWFYGRHQSRCYAQICVIWTNSKPFLVQRSKPKACDSSDSISVTTHSHTDDCELTDVRIQSTTLCVLCFINFSRFDVTQRFRCPIERRRQFGENLFFFSSVFSDNLAQFRQTTKCEEKKKKRKNRSLLCVCVFGIRSVPVCMPNCNVHAYMVRCAVV